MRQTWRRGWEPVVGQWRSDQIADQANWTTIGLTEEDRVDHGIGSIERRAGGVTVVNPLDPVASGLREVPPGRARQHGLSPIPVGRP